MKGIGKQIFIHLFQTISVPTHWKIRFRVLLPTQALD